MKIKYILTEDDYLKFNLYHTKNSKTIQKSLLIQRLMGPIIFIIFSFVFAKLADLSVLGLFITFFTISVLWFVYYPKSFYKTIMKNVKKAINEGSNEGLLGTHFLTLSNKGLVDTTSTGRTEVQWAGITEVKEDDDNIYLYNSSVSACILPKREVRNIEELRALLAQHVK